MLLVLKKWKKPVRTYLSTYLSTYQSTYPSIYSTYPSTNLGGYLPEWSNCMETKFKDYILDWSAQERERKLNCTYKEEQKVLSLFEKAFWKTTLYFLKLTTGKKSHNDL